MNHGFSKIFIVIGTVVILLIIGGFFVWRSQWVLGKTTVLWKVYNSPVNGFSIKYPRNWEVIPEDPKYPTKTIVFRKLVNNEIDVLFKIEWWPKWFYSQDKGRNLTFEETVGQTWETVQNDINPERKEIILGSQPAVSISGTYEYPGNYLRENNIFEKSKNVLITTEIHKYNDVQNDRYSPIFNQMLSTFRFLE